MLVLVSKVFTSEPVAAELAVDSQLNAVKLEMLENTLEGMELLLAAEALHLESFALCINMLLKVDNEDTLWNVVLFAFVIHLDLSYHLVQ